MQVMRNFVHKAHGEIGNVVFKIENDVFTIDGNVLSDASATYLMNFALQSLQDAYANSKNWAEAQGNWAKKRDALLNGTIGVRQSNGETEEQKVRHIVTKRALGKNPKLDSFGDDIDSLNAFLDAVYAKNESKLSGEFDAELLRREELRKTKAAAKALLIDIDI